MGNSTSRSNRSCLLSRTASQTSDGNSAKLRGRAPQCATCTRSDRPVSIGAPALVVLAKPQLSHLWVRCGRAIRDVFLERDKCGVMLVGLDFEQLFARHTSTRTSLFCSSSSYCLSFSASVREDEPAGRDVSEEAPLDHFLVLLLQRDLCFLRRLLISVCVAMMGQFSPSTYSFVSLITAPEYDEWQQAFPGIPLELPG